MRKKRILMIEDSLSMAAIYNAYLNESNYQVRMVTDLDSAYAEIERETPDIILLDVELPDGSGLTLLKEVQLQTNDIEIIVMTAHGSSQMAVQAIEDGAFDFLIKPFDGTRLLVTLDNATKHQDLNRKIATYSSFDIDQYCRFIGKSLPMQAVYKTIDSLAASSATAFIIGESGTGKELAAEAIHQKSNRTTANFHALNCAAIPRELMESELFGHVKGAFTGATSDREGAAAIADGGTLFLDEICEMDFELQKKLLRFIQTGSYQKVGSNKMEIVNIRFVCATNRDPMQEVREGRFREDLFYRLHVVPVHMPPLRQRENDILMLAQAFLAKFASRDGKRLENFSSDAKQLLLNYPWRGNVRELENAIQNVVVLHDGETVQSYMLPMRDMSNESIPPIQIEQSSNDGRTSNHISQPITAQGNKEISPLWLEEKAIIERAIKLCNGSINKAAGKLEVAPSTLYRKIQSWNLLA
jgi:two-component system repressor protein LuxO|tara:strand:- start:244 stop:1656 length:1413 start_codon:yes stop_codon:yes gene_type:complete